MFVCQETGYPETIHATVTFDPESGIAIDKCNNSKARECWEGLMAQDLLYIEPEIVIEKQVPASLKRHLEGELLEEAKKQMPEGSLDHLYDSFGYHLFHAKVPKISVQIELSNFTVLENFGTVTTEFRYTHMLTDLVNCLGERLKERLVVCVVGPGLVEGRSPELAQLVALLPNSHFDVVDSDTGLIKELNAQKERGALCYSALTYRMLTSETSYKAADADQKMLQLFAQGAIAKAKDGPAVGLMLAGIGVCQDIEITINPKKLRVVKFDLLTQKLSAQIKYDLVIAIQSISNAALTAKEKNPNYDLLKPFWQFAKALKDKGILYIDLPYFKVARGSMGGEAWNQKWKAFEEGEGAQYPHRAIPLTMEDPKCVSEQTMLSRPHLHQGKMVLSSVSSCSLIAVQRIEKR